MSSFSCIFISHAICNLRFHSDSQNYLSGITSTVFMAVGIIWVILITIMCIVYASHKTFIGKTDRSMIGYFQFQ